MKRPHKQLSLKECYDVLNVDKGVTLEDVKHAYRRRAFELHPDLNPNNPDASRQFQLLNEAYVALTAVLENTSASSKDKTANAKEQQKENPHASASHEKQTESNSASSTNRESAQRRTTTKGYREEDVLRDLLQDPFARRVFEDIYSELHKQQATTSATSSSSHEDADPKPSAKKSQPSRPQKPIHDTTKLHQGNLAWDTPNWNSNINKGVTGVVKGWLRRQIDEEQSLTIPKTGLVPGQRIRLQIRQGFQGGLKTVEITLPPDFTPGKAVRLKGLGKRVGPWQGDLYLTLRGE